MLFTVGDAATSGAGGALATDAVEGKYGVWVTSSERDAMSRVLSACPSMRLPGPGSAPTVAVLPR